MYKQAIIASALLAIASAAQGEQFGHSRQAIVLECGVVPPQSGPIGMPPPASPSPEVIAVSRSSGAPEISVGNPCGDAIGELMNSRFRLLSATPTSPTILVDLPPQMPTEVSSVQYLFVSQPGNGDR